MLSGKKLAESVDGKLLDVDLEFAQKTCSTKRNMCTDSEDVDIETLGKNMRNSIELDRDCIVRLANEFKQEL